MTWKAGSEPAARPIALRVEKLVGGGRGLAHRDGTPWMVAGGLPGEEVVAVAELRRAGVVEARVVAVSGRPHPARLAEPCPHASACGGCDWPHVDATAGALLKAETAAEAGHRFGEVARSLGAAQVRESSLSYRLRARLHWDPTRGLLGFYAQRSRSVTDIPSCRIVSPRLARARGPLASALAATCPEPIDVEWLEDLDGTVAVAALRPSPEGRSGPELSWVPPQALAGDVVDGLWVLDHSGRLRGGWGRSSVTMRLPVPLEVPIGAFFQVNRHLARWLFDRVAAVAGPDPVPAFDLHAGVGFLAAAASTAAPRELRLVEPYRSAAWAARRNLPGARVAVGRTVEAYLARSRHLPRRALVLVDPPRAGMSRALRRRLLAWRPERLLMLSCEPATWARDASELVDNGFALAHLELVDLFPSTHHVEILSVLESG